MEHRVMLPRGLVVDVMELPEDFDEKVRKAFMEYTNGTAEDYRYHDQLAFIDLCCCYAHSGTSGHHTHTETAVNKLVTDRMRYEWEENNEFVSEEDIYSKEFMCECYDEGSKLTKLYGHHTGDHHIDDAVMKMLCRVIRIVMDIKESA